jgi:hypothetical protein
MRLYGIIKWKRPINLLRPQPKINHFARLRIYNGDIAQVAAVEEDEADGTTLRG